MICSQCGTENRIGDRFCEHCGSTLVPDNDSAAGASPAPPPQLQPAALVRLDGSNQETYALGSRTVVGRLDSCDLSINDKSVSREHARLSRLRDGYVVEDLGSTNGTLVNGRRIDEAVILRPGDVLTIGSIDFRFDQQQPANVADPVPARAAAAHGAEQIDSLGSVAVDEPPASGNGTGSHLRDFASSGAATPVEDVDGSEGGQTVDQPAHVPTPASEIVDMSDILELSDRLRRAVQDFAAQQDSADDLRAQLEQERDAADRGRLLRAEVRGLLDTVPGTPEAEAGSESVRSLLDALSRNPKDIEVLLDIAQRAGDIREIVDRADEQRRVLQRIEALTEA